MEQHQKDINDFNKWILYIKQERNKPISNQVNNN